MKSDYQLVLDASADLDPIVSQNYEVAFIPMDYTIGNESFQFNGGADEAQMKRLYDSQRQKDLTRTSQITPFIYEKFFESILKKGKSVLYLSLSSGLSNTFQSSLLASENLKAKYPNQDVICIDSLAATGGIGVLAQLAIDNKNAGMPLEQNAEIVRNATKNIRHYFMVDDLGYLKRGGRISTVSAALGELFQFKPILEIDEAGKLATIDKKRGRKNGLIALMDLFEKHCASGLTNVVYLTHSDCLMSASYIKGELLLKHPDLKIYTRMMSPVIGAHTGPDTITVCFLGS